MKHNKIKMHELTTYIIKNGEGKSKSHTSIIKPTTYSNMNIEIDITFNKNNFRSPVNPILKKYKYNLKSKKTLVPSPNSINNKTQIFMLELSIRLHFRNNAPPNFQ